jgi:hypothetical protein
MEPTHADSTQKLLLWRAPIVLGHFVAVIWHLFLLVRVQPSTPTVFPPLLILFNLFSVAGLVALAKGFRKLAGRMIDILVAIATTKIPVPPKSGFWATMHEARTDVCMLLGLIFLLIVGSGSLSFDDLLSRQADRHV